MFQASTGRSQDDGPMPQPLVSFPAPDLEPALPDPPGQPDTLRSRYLELADEKAALMDEGALQQEIEQTQLQIAELKAAKKLREAKEALASITKEFPESEAARTASRMLSVLEQREFLPVPEAGNAVDRGFDPNDFRAVDELPTPIRVEPEKATNEFDLPADSEFKPRTR